jgi:hypothetical protein
MTIPVRGLPISRSSAPCALSAKPSPLSRDLHVRLATMVLGRREEQDTAKQPHRILQQQMPASGLLPQNLRCLAQPGDHPPVINQVGAAIEGQEQPC